MADAISFRALGEYDPAMRTALAMLAVCVAGCGCVPATPAPPSTCRDATPRLAAVSVQERAMLEAKIREHLTLPADAALGPAEFSRVTELDLKRTQVSDAGAAWIADPATGLTALATLYLQLTPVTDAGAKAAARADSGLAPLHAIFFHGTAVTDAGVTDLARVDTGLRSLKTLDPGKTAVTDAGIRVLAQADSGLTSLTALHLRETKVTDAGIVAVLARRPAIKIVR